MRDYQKQKVYDAEKEWWKEIGTYPQLELDEIKEIAEKILRAFGKEHAVKIRDGRGSKSASADEYYLRGVRIARLNFPLWSRNLPVVCHEVSHVVAGCHYGHLPHFCRMYLRVVRHFMGPKEAASLQRHLMKKRVVVSEAQEKFRDDRVRALRARGTGGQQNGCTLAQIP